MKYLFILAGEASGDIHAASLAQDLYQWEPTLHISGIGGDQMKMARVNLIFNLAQYAVTGLSEVISHLFIIYKAYKALLRSLRENKPDLLILVDYPGFNLRVAKQIKKKFNIPILYYISPQVWAWKSKRLETIRRYIDWMAVILPFEKKIYQEAGIPAFFVGHPLVKNINSPPPPSTQNQSLTIGLLPGSRTNEIRRHLPVLIETAKCLTEEIQFVKFILPIASTISSTFIKSFFSMTNLPVTFTQTPLKEALLPCDFVFVASGTASLETALLEKPMAIIYKSSWLTFMVAMKVIKVKYLGLCNLMAQKMIVPEFLQYDCTPKELVTFLRRSLIHNQSIEKMRIQLRAVKQNLSLAAADYSILELVKKVLTKELQ